MIFDRVSASAKPIGGELIAQEQVLDQLFAKGDITPDRLAAATAVVPELQGRLRAVHLSAHLETRALLTPIKSPVTSSSRVMAIRRLRPTIVTMDRGKSPVEHPPSRKRGLSRGKPDEQIS